MKFLGKWLPLFNFNGSADYWRKRYRLGGDSGPGSGGQSASYKAMVLNQFVADHGIESVIEFGCGDGRQLELARYPSYIGLDISPEAVALCREKFSGDEAKQFLPADAFESQGADLSLSLDVFFHLVEDRVYRDYMKRLFSASSRYVAIYSTTEESPIRTLPHVRHRPLVEDIERWLPDFVRLHDYEAILPPPDPEWSNGARFIFYARKP